MSKTIMGMRLKLQKAWLKLLKAEAKRKSDKVYKWEKRVIDLELQIKEME